MTSSNRPSVSAVYSRLMTFSLAVHDSHTGHVGVAAMTAMPSVGKLVGHARSKVGAAATQALVNPYLAFDGLDLLGEGIGASEVLATVIGNDPGRDGRQFGIVDVAGGSASYTGMSAEGLEGAPSRAKLRLPGKPPCRTFGSRRCGDGLSPPQR